MNGSSIEYQGWKECQTWLLSAVQGSDPADQTEVAAVIRQDRGQLTPAERLSIYSHSYHGRLLRCMEGEFPVLRLALGEDLFARFGSEYLRTYPPQSYTLHHLGESFPQYLRETRPPDPAEVWPEFIIELATLERICNEVYHGDGPEQQQEKATENSRDIAQEPWTRFMTCQFPLHRYYTEAKDYVRAPGDQSPPDFPEPAPVKLMIFRREYVVRLREISSP